MPLVWEIVAFVASSREFENSEFALDDWIDLYCSGRLESLEKGSSRPPSSRKIPTYDGKVLCWLECIALFRTSVHDMESSVSERAGALLVAPDPALVRICVTQSATEEGYKQSLMALKQRCGDRTVMPVWLPQLLLSLESSAKALRGRAA